MFHLPSTSGLQAINRYNHCDRFRVSRCPLTNDLSLTYSTDDVNPDEVGNQPMPEGPNAIGAIPFDVLVKGIGVEAGTVKVDRSAPDVKLSGHLKDAANTVIRDNDYGVLVQATDGSDGAARSGVKSAEFLVDGVRKDFVEQPCPEGSCGLEYDWILRSEEYPPGQHTITVKVADQLGQTWTDSWSVTIDHSPTSCPATLDYEVYSLGAEYDGLKRTNVTRFCEPYDPEYGQNKGLLGFAWLIT